MAKCASLSHFLRMEWFPARIGVALLITLGLVNVFMVRVNLSVAIVAMVHHNTSAATSDLQAHCQALNGTRAGGMLVSPALGEATGRENTTVSPALLVDPVEWGTEDQLAVKGKDVEEKGGTEVEERLHWDEWMQGQVLGSFFYGYWISQVVGGRLAEIYGTKLVFGITVLSGGVAAVFTPIAARTHYLALVTLRAVQGFMQGAAYPCIFPLMVRWFPRFEQSKFVAFVLFCNNISITFTLALCGLVIDSLGWDNAFHVTGACSFAWCILWYFLMYNDPADHPRITQKELSYITESNGPCPNCKELKQSSLQTLAAPRSSSAPWLSLAKSLPMWAIMVAEIGNSFGYSVYFSYLPTYIENVIGVPISQNGLLSSLPFLARYLGGVVFASIGECLLIRGKLTVLTARRIFSIVAMIGPALMMLAVAYSGCRPALAITLLCLGFFFNGSITIGVFANKAEVSLHYAGTVCGLGNTCANLTSLVVPLVVGAITNNQQSLAAWQKVFWTCVPMYVVCEVFFFVFVSASRQPWDLLEDEKPQDQVDDTRDKEKEGGESVEPCAVCGVSPWANK